MGAITVVGGIYLLWDFFQEENEYKVNERSAEEKRKEITTNSDRYKAEGDPLKIYSKGDNVKCLQNVLNKLGVKDKNNSALTTDGMFGPLTESATENAGWGKSVSLDKLKTELQTLVNDGKNITCNSSCCKDVVKVETLINEDGDGSVDSIVTGYDDMGFVAESDNTYVVPPFIPPNLTFSGSWFDN